MLGTLREEILRVAAEREVVHPLLAPYYTRSSI
jgi:hypothetical protein